MEKANNNNVAAAIISNYILTIVIIGLFFIILLAVVIVLLLVRCCSRKEEYPQLMTLTPSSFTSGEKMVWQEGTRDASIALCDLKEKVAGFEYLKATRGRR